MATYHSACAVRCHCAFSYPFVAYEPDTFRDHPQHDGVPFHFLGADACARFSVAGICAALRAKTSNEAGIGRLFVHSIADIVLYAGRSGLIAYSAVATIGV